MPDRFDADDQPDYYNGRPEGRFGRMEAKLDILTHDLTEFRVDVSARLARLEEKNAASREVNAERVSDRSYLMMKLGISASFVVGVVSLILRIKGV